MAPISRDSADWQAIEARTKDAIRADRAALEAPQLGIEQTEFLRGRIAAMRDVLSWPDRPHVIPDVALTASNADY